MNKILKSEVRRGYQASLLQQQSKRLQFDKYIHSKDIYDDIVNSFNLLRDAHIFSYDIHAVQVCWLLDYLRSKSKVYFFLGMRQCGKSELLTQFLTAFLLSKFPSLTFMIFCRNEQLASNNVYAIAQMLKVLNVKLVSANQDGLRTVDNLENDKSVIAMSINKPLKGYHVDFAILDDALDSNDRYSDVTKDRVEHVKNQVQSACKRELIVGQLVAIDDFYVKARIDYNNQLERFKNGNTHEDADQGGVVVKEFWLHHAKKQMYDVPFFANFDEELQIKNTSYADFCLNYAGILPVNSVNNPLSNTQIVSTPKLSETRCMFAYLDPAKGGGDFTSITFFMIAKHDGVYKAHILNHSTQSDWRSALEVLQKNKAQEWNFLAKTLTFIVEDNILGINDKEYLHDILKGVNIVFERAKVNKFQRICDGVSLLRSIGNGIVICDLTSQEMFNEFQMYDPLRITALKHDDALDATAGLMIYMFNNLWSDQILLEMGFLNDIVIINQHIKRSREMQYGINF